MISLSGQDTAPEHQHYAEAMAAAIALASQVLTTTPNPRVGCVVMGPNNTVLGKGWHQFPGGAHAEVMALEQAGAGARGATVFVSLEPCAHQGKTPPCADALIRAGVKTVVIAGLDPFPQVAGAGVRKLEAAGIKVIHMYDFEQAARQLNRGYFQRQETGRPFVRCKLAMSLDGRTAVASGESQWISSAEARRDVQRLRAGSCAIVTGINTVLMDDPALTLRPAELALSTEEQQLNGFALQRQPLRVILDSGLRIADLPQAKSLQGPGSSLIFTVKEKPGAFPANVEVISLTAKTTGATGDGTRVDGRAVLELLASRYQVNEVLLEAGPTLAGAWLAAGLVDELVVYTGACLLGQAGRPLLNLPDIVTMADKRPLEITDLIRIGADLRITARPGTV